jgi:TM2 domain-containing membrane protein YozV
MVMAMSPGYLWTMPGTLVRYCAVIVFSLLMVLSAQASGPYVGKGIAVDLSEAGPLLTAADSSITGDENTRLVAGVLAAVLGPFGAHRLYLGTTPKVAIIYGLTFGGFGVLALIDLGHIVFAKETGHYQNNAQVIMWSERHAAAVTPP